MLAISLAAILTACVLLWLEMRAYNYDIRAQEGQFVGSLDGSPPYALRTPGGEPVARIPTCSLSSLG